ERGLLGHHDLDAQREAAHLARAEGADTHHATRHGLAALVVDLDEDRVLPRRLIGRMADGAVDGERTHRRRRGTGHRHGIEPEVSLTGGAGHRAPEDALSAVRTVPRLARRRRARAHW